MWLLGELRPSTVIFIATDRLHILCQPNDGDCHIDHKVKWLTELSAFIAQAYKSLDILPGASLPVTVSAYDDSKSKVLASFMGEHIQSTVSQIFSSKQTVLGLVLFTNC